MGRVPVARLGLLVVVQPLLQLPVTPDPERGQPSARGGDPGTEVGVDIEQLGALRADAQHSLHEDPVRGGTHGHRTPAAVGCEVPVLRRFRRPGDEPALLRLVDRVSKEELGGPANDRVRTIPEERLIAAVLVVLPQLEGKPGTAGHVHSPSDAGSGCRVPPCVGHCVRDPARCAVHLLGGRPAMGRESLQETEQWLLALGQVGRLGGPVALLGVHVQVEVVRPGRAAGQAVVPQSLQRQRQGGVPAGAGHRKVATVLEVERYESVVGLPGGEPLAACVGGQGRDVGRRRSEIQ